jgi:hypothetical protein
LVLSHWTFFVRFSVVCFFEIPPSGCNVKWFAPLYNSVTHYPHAISFCLITMQFNIILPSKPSLSSGHLPSDFLTKTLYAFLFFPCVPRVQFITRIIFGEDCNFSHHSVLRFALLRCKNVHKRRFILAGNAWVKLTVAEEEGSGTIYY